MRGLLSCYNFIRRYMGRLALVPILFLFPLLFLSFFAIRTIDGLIFFEKDYYFLIFGFLMVAAVALFTTRWTFNTIDGIFLLYTAYQVIRSSVVDAGGISSWMPPVMFFLLYFGVKQFLSGDLSGRLLVIGQILIVTAIAYMLHGLLQQLGMLTPSSTLAKASGYYSNPAPYAGLLSILLPFITVRASMLLQKPDRDLRFADMVYFILAVAGMATIIFTKSRAALLATGASLVLAQVLYSTVNQHAFLKFRFVWAGVFCAALIVLSIVLYHMRPASAQGRALIWKIALQTMVTESPFIGHGSRAFEQHYMHYQANYFSNPAHRATLQEKLSVTNTPYAFNEFMRILTEEGILGLALFLSIVFFVFRAGWLTLQTLSGREREMLMTCMASLTAAIVFANFSYPFSDKTFLTIFWVTTAVISGMLPQSFAYIPPHYLKLSMGVSLLGIAILLYPTLHTRYKAYDTWRSYRFTASQLEGLQNSLASEGLYYMDYAESLYKNQEISKAIDILNCGKAHTSNPQLFLKLAIYYDEGENNIAQAEENYRTVSAMLPYTYLPKYRLLKMYVRIGTRRKAAQVAKEIMDMPVKIPSASLDQIKDYAQKIVTGSER